MHRQHPSETDLHARAAQHIAMQQWSAAQALLEAQLEHVPTDVAARMELARVLLRQGLMRASAHQLAVAARHPVADATLNVQLVQRLYVSGDAVSARECLQRFERMPNLPPHMLAAQAHLRWMLGEFEAAKVLLEAALSKGLDEPGEHHFHATLLQITGAIERAGKVLEMCLRRWPGFGSAAVSASHLRKQTATTQRVNVLREQLERHPADSANPDHRFVRAQFAAALFKELDDLGQCESAWQALAHSNALMHALNPYDAAGEAAVTDALIDACADAKTIHTAPKQEGPVPIFIVGMPRSGTTLLDRMLSNHSQVTSAGEINDMLRQLHWAADVVPVGVPGMLQAIRRSSTIDFAALGERYLQQTQWRARGRPYYIDKLPGNIQMVSFIRRALPHAPILHMVRDPMDVCFSNFRAMFGNISAYSYDMRALAHYYGLYQRVVRHWHTVMPGAMFEVSYADLVHQPEATLRRVLDHCGLAIEENCLHPERNDAPVATPSSVQVREPIYTHAVGQWRRYARQLEPLRLALANP